MNSNFNNKNEKILHEYKYGTRKALAVFGVLIFGGVGVFFLIGSWQHKQALIAVPGFLSILVCFLGLYGSRGDKKIKVYEDRIEVPKGPFSKKINTVHLKEIIGVNESKVNGIPLIEIWIDGKNRVAIASAQMIEKDFYEFLEYLEKIHKKPVDRLSPVESEKILKKVKVYKWISVIFPILVIVGTRIFTGKLNTLHDLIPIAVLISIMIGTNFLIYKAKESKVKPTNGSNSLLSKLEARKLKNKWELIVYSPAIISLLSIPFFLKIPHEGITSIWPPISYGMSGTFFLLFVLSLFLPNVDGVVSTGDKILCYSLSGIMTFFVSIFFFICLNINLDKNSSVHKMSFLTDKFTPNKYENERCYRVAHWETGEGIFSGDEAYCTYKYPGIKDKEKIAFLLHEGFLGIPWISDVKILKYQSLQMLMLSIDGELNLRFEHVEYMAKLHGKSIWQPYLEVWDKECRKVDFRKCRLASYVAELNGKNEQSRAYLKISCGKKDFISCYNYFVYPEFSKSDLEIAKNNILEQCGSSDDSVKKGICDFVKNIEAK